MAYATKPSFLKKDSVMYKVLNALVKSTNSYVEDFDNTSRKDGLYPASRHGLATVYKNGKAMITAAGRKLVSKAK